MNIKLFLALIICLCIIFYHLQKKKHHLTSLVSQKSDVSFINNVSSPYGITVVDSGIFVSNIFSNEIIHFSHNGERLDVWKFNEFKYPHSVLVEDNFFFVVSNYKGKILKIDTKEKTAIPIFEAIGNQLKGPTHVLRMLNSGFLITDFDANKVFFVKSDMTMDVGMTRFVNEQVALNRPHMSAQDSFGNIYIADCWNHRLVKLNPSGHLIGWTGFDVKDPMKKEWRLEGAPSKSEEIGGFNAPASIHIFDDVIYVAEVENHRIQRLNLQGKSLGVLGAMDKNGECILKWTTEGRIQKSNKLGCLNHPYDSYIFDKKIYIADSKNQRIQIIPLDILD